MQQEGRGQEGRGQEGRGGREATYTIHLDGFRYNPDSIDTPYNIKEHEAQHCCDKQYNR